MKRLFPVGLILVVIGAALLIWDSVPTKEKHSAKVMGMEMSVTTKTERKIPKVVGGSILGLGVALTLVGALQKKA